MYRFIYNLNRGTVDARIHGFTNPDGYLLSIHRYSPQMVRFATELRSDYEEVIVADNGFFERIRHLQDEFRERAKLLFERVKLEEKRLGTRLRKNTTPEALRADYVALAKDIRTRLYEVEEQGRFAEVIADQQLINPHKWMVPEDILLSTLVGLNVEPEYTGLPSSFYSYRNERSARFYQKALMGEYGDVSGQPYAVASAVDYNSAHYAGRIMARSGVRSVAIGTGAFMADNDYTDHYVIGRKTFNLERLAPRRYLRTVLTAKGLMDGYMEESGKAPEAIHFLGLGTPIMILMTGWICRAVDDVSYDATSPIKDAVEGTVYATEPTYLKMRTRKLAHWYASQVGSEWVCTCAYCQSFSEKYPFDYEAAHSSYEEEGQPSKITSDMLRDSHPLCLAMPFLSEPSSGQRRKDISEWRIGHNHLMLDIVMQEMNEASDAGNLEGLIQRKLDAYFDVALPHFAYAISLAWDLSQTKI